MSQAAASPTDPAQEPNPQWSRVQLNLAALAMGVAAGIIGLLPWLLSGRRLSLQNFWMLEAAPETMPFSALPLSQYSLFSLLVLLVAGGVIGGLAARYFPAGNRRSMIWCTVGGLLLVHSLAALQSFVVLGSGLGIGSQVRQLAQVYFFGLLCGVLLLIIATALLLGLIAARSRAAAAVGFGLAAVPASSWFIAWFSYLLPQGQLPNWISVLDRWLPAVIVGIVLVWCGLRPVSRLLVWAANLLLLWSVPAAVTAQQYAFGSRVLAGNLADTADAFGQVFRQALGPAGDGGFRLVVALAIAVLGTAVREVVVRRSAQADAASSA
ncbi:MAG: hypothetical protein IIZ13_04830 [Renibacterium sp.]|nr:hypothetical protein [Renibacterium sp.]